MTDIQKIKDEIESRIVIHKKWFGASFGHAEDIVAELQEVLSFIDSMTKDQSIDVLKKEIGDELLIQTDAFLSQTTKDWLKQCAEIDRAFFYSLPLPIFYNDLVKYGKYMVNWQKEQMIKDIWKKSSDAPSNRHPYPVINSDTLEMAFAYYYHGWQFDRDFNPGLNMLWLDIEMILPNKLKEAINEKD
jgi:hypothetical protein